MVAGYKSRVAGFKKVAGFEKSRVFLKVAGCQKTVLYEYNEEQNLHVIKLMRIFAKLSLHLFN